MEGHSLRFKTSTAVMSMVVACRPHAGAGIMTAMPSFPPTESWSTFTDGAQPASSPAPRGREELLEQLGGDGCEGALLAATGGAPV